MLIKYYQRFKYFNMQREHDKITSDELEQKKNNFSSKRRINQVLCPEGFKAVFICISKQCNQPSFSCEQQICKCEKIHQHCCTKRVKSVISKIQQKLCHFNPIIQKTKLILQEKISYFKVLIEQLVKEKQQFVKNLQQDVLCGLLQTQKKIYKAMISKKTDQVKGNSIFNLDLQLKSQNKYIIQNQIKMMKQIFSQDIQEFKTMRQKIKKLLEYYQNKQYQLKIFAQTSNIIKDSQDIELLNSLFKNKILKTKLLYRASQNQFKIQKFKQNCEYASHTLTLIQTTLGYKVGIYTPLKWRKQPGIVIDNLKKTIMCSLTQQQVLECSSGFNMLVQKQKGPAFVYGNSYEGTKFSIQQMNNINFGKTFLYQNSLKQKVLFCQKGFLTKQWQVWQVLLDDQNLK